MTPSFENLKIYGEEVICSLISSNQISSFGFLFNSNENLTLSKDFKITIDDAEYIRKCQLIKNSNTELYLKFKKIRCVIKIYNNGNKIIFILNVFKLKFYF